jgi:replicative DNA helicase
MEQNRFVNALGEMADWPLFIDDKGGATIMHIDRQARKWHRQHGIKAIIIDYLQLITTPDKFNREDQKISSFTKHLKKLAKSLNIPVILLSQLNRSVEVRGGTKRPNLSDLRESGAIEEDADIVQFIYRPEYYGILENEEGISLKGISEIIYAKHRNGALRTLICRFNENTTEFFDTEDYAPVTAKEESDHIQIPASSRPGKDDEIPF